MDLLGLPLDIISAVIDQLVLSCNLRAGLHLRHVNHLFDREILRAYFTSGIINFHADAPNTKVSRDNSWKAVKAREFLLNTNNYQARRMSKFHAARLLCGRLEALKKYGPDLPWLYKLEAAAGLLRRISRPSPLAISPIMPLNEDAVHRETMQQLCAVITDYLGVSEVIDSLDTTKQDLCCRHHYLPIYNEGCSVPSFEPSKRLRRPELPLDWAILTAMYTRDFAVIPRLLESQRFQLGPNPKLSASLQYSAGRKCETTFRLLLDAGVDINGLGHATGGPLCDDSDWNLGSALEAACAAGCIGIVKICLSPKYNLKSSGDFYESAMIIAARLDNHELGLNIVKWLMSRLTSWCDFSWTTQIIFQIACRNGNVDLGKLVFENAPYDLNVPSTDVESPLGMAVEHGHANMVSYTLSQHRTCLDRFPHHGAGWRRHCELNRAMRRAAQFGQAHIASLIWNELDYCPMRKLLYEAARHGHTSMIEFLLSKGLDLSEQKSANGNPETIGEYALRLAAEHAQKSTTRFLLGLGIRTLNLDPFSCVEEDAGYAARSEEGVQNL